MGILNNMPVLQFQDLDTILPYFNLGSQSHMYINFYLLILFFLFFFYSKFLTFFHIVLYYI